MLANGVQIISSYVVRQVVGTRNIQPRYFPTIPVYTTMYRAAEGLYFVITSCMSSLIWSWADTLPSLQPVCFSHFNSIGF